VSTTPAETYPDIWSVYITLSPIWLTKTFPVLFSSFITNYKIPCFPCASGFQ